MKIILISGKARHGKDTAAQFFKNELELRGNNVLISHYADLLKYICRQFFGWNGEKDDVGRTMLQEVGTNTIRKEEPDFLANFVLEILKLFPNEWDYVIIPDCRFENEITIMKGSGIETVHVRVERSDGFVSPLSPEQQTHISETALDNVVPDIRIVNDGSKTDLGNKVKELVIGGVI